ncbi:hypothetical protein D6D08_10396 [Aureobasidium pullulans]|nr:hypothetical protein D6D08_10396 [Aureobasidium pullulans]
MAEVAGLVLGGVPLIVMAMQSYREFLEYGGNYLKYDDLLQEIKDAVSIQQDLLYGTFETIGLHEPNYDELGARLQELYPGKHDLFMREIRRMEVTVSELMKELCLDSLGKPRWSGEQLARMEYEWRKIKRAVSSKKTKKLIDQLQERNAQLSGCLRRSEIFKGQSSPMVQTLQARFNLREFDAIRQHACDIKDTLDACWHCSCSDRHSTSLDLDWQSNPPNGLPKFGVSLSYTKSSGGVAIANGPEWQKIRTHIEGQSSNSPTTKGAQVLALRSVNVIHGPTVQQATTPKKSFFSRKQPQTPSPLPSPSISAASSAPSLTEIKSLCQFLQELEKDGSNLGFLLTPGEKKRVHIAPVAKAHLPSTEPVTLESLMSPKTPVAHLSLSRRKRFEIAAAAAWATLLLYDTPWLTDTWDKAGLYFFLEKNTTNNIFAANPCISTEVNNATSTRRFQNKLIRNEAVFALGILLIELCLNRPFDELSKQGSTGNGSNSIMEDYEMANILLDQVFLDAGDLYGDACRLCIRFEFPGRDVGGKPPNNEIRGPPERVT